MPETPTMTYGARKGSWNPLKKLAAKFISKDLTYFVVPGADVARSYGIHLKQIASSPREANVLLISGKTPASLAKKASVAYAQMPRPRMSVFMGVDELTHLPNPDLVLSTGTKNVENEISRHFAKCAWSMEARPFKTEMLNQAEQEASDGQEHDHEHHTHGEDGSEDEEQEDSDDKDHGHAHHHHQKDEEESKEDGDKKHHEHHHSDHNESNDDDEGSEHEGHQHGDGGHDMGGGFMSMVAMTKDMPRSMDGLAMEMNPVHFGPFLPGLPGGLSISMMLDGDTVIKPQMEKQLACRNLRQVFPAEPNQFIEHLSQVNPLTPVAYRLLAKRTLRRAFNTDEDERLAKYELMLLEKERILSHLNWLSVFSQTLGNSWMHQKASVLFDEYQKGKPVDKDIIRFLQRVKKMPYLKKRLMQVGMIPENLLHHTSGPVARAAGEKRDGRIREAAYQTLAFEPIVAEQNNAWGRLLVRLKDIEQSLQLVQKAGNAITEEETAFDNKGSGTGKAAIETPRGRAELTVEVREGKVKDFDLKTPSWHHAALIADVATMQELADALVGIASLDLAPWEVDM